MRNILKDAYYAILSHAFSDRMTRANLGSRFDIGFKRDEHGLWYADIPSWPGSRAQLLMVSHAHDFLENVNRLEGLDGIVKMTVAAHAQDAEGMQCARKVGQDGSGATYQCENEKYGKYFWLCNVSKWCFGEHPTEIYYKLTNIEIDK